MNELMFALLLHETSPREIKRENTRFLSSSLENSPYVQGYRIINAF